MKEVKHNPIKEQVALLPLSPGVYQFVDRTGTIIYVGKAKSLRKRVSSYFVESKEHSAKVRVLVKQIAEIRHIVVDSEQDALLLDSAPIRAAALLASSFLTAAISSIESVEEPTFPFVAVAVKTLCPAFAYFARVPPQEISISSGCAPIAKIFIFHFAFLEKLCLYSYSFICHPDE